MSQPVVDRPVTVPELQRIVAPAETGTIGMDAVDAGGEQQAVAPAPVMVLGAHPGAGASTVAVALADSLAHAAAGPGGSVRLIDLSPRESSGLVCAAGRELGGEQSGWMSGRRGAVTVERVASARVDLGRLPPLRHEPGGRVVLDAGCASTGLPCWPRWGSDLAQAPRLVLVCHASVPGVRRAEVALSRLTGEPLLVSVGSRSWPGPVAASCGHRTRAAHDSGRIWFIPHDRRLAVEGIDDRPLPRHVMAAAGRVAGQLQPPRQRATTTRPKGRNRWTW